MNGNRTQNSQLVTAEILELTEQMLNLAEQMENLANQMLNFAIPTQSQGSDINGDWTMERFETLVPQLLRESYRDQNRNGELYRLGATLKNFIQERQWELNHQFAVKHIFFFSGNRRLFGINLFSSRPRLTFCGVTERDVRSIVPKCSFTAYPQYSQLVCHRGPTVEDLSPLFEFIYNNNSS